MAEAYEVLCEDQQVICQFFSEEDFLYAADEGDLEEVRSLLEAGVDLFTTNKHGFTALHKAAQRGIRAFQCRWARAMSQAGTE